MSTEQFTVEHLASQSRYVLQDTEAPDTEGPLEIGQEAYVDVDRDGSVERVLYHTVVSEAYGGRGLASILVQNVVDDIIAQGYKIVPVCPYVAKWIEKNSQYDEHVVQPTPEHLQRVRAHTRS